MCSFVNSDSIVFFNRFHCLDHFCSYSADQLKSLLEICDGPLNFSSFVYDFNHFGKSKKALATLNKCHTFSLSSLITLSLIVCCSVLDKDSLDVEINVEK